MRSGNVHELFLLVDRDSVGRLQTIKKQMRFLQILWEKMYKWGNHLSVVVNDATRSKLEYDLDGVSEHRLRRSVVVYEKLPGANRDEIVWPAVTLILLFMPQS